ncbi:molybdopterin molybdotransferase MoeA [Starkeya sp. ORNL1]|uniref:molybdopterin molybdotransferase MoeA n=1 Tax=Starkeya sp. ORNL1 TaxID=2709380 RepID=UPI001463C1C9|nr:gephyrin-like molybdotransferase Glp [Starkeya sp. ORNL1]QJP16836.1 molybdopterin molybdotransferase MoeA [Starkeya sp. ORNL1]
MVQLSNDCFASSSSTLTVEQAVALALENLPVAAAVERVPLSRADGRIAGADIFALNDVPPFANSAVDGYAVRHADLNPGSKTVLPLRGRLPAGSFEALSAAGHAVRIFTGAAMPKDADTVFMQEDVHSEGDFVQLPAGLRAGSNMRPAGEDVARGERIIAKGRRLRPQDLALAAASGHRLLPVRRPLRVALFSSGNELVKPGVRLEPGKIYDSNRIMLAAMLNRFGVKVLDGGILPDNREKLAERLGDAAELYDLILSSGGVSTGEEDHMRAVIEATGRVVFWRLAIKPGRPLAMGSIGRTPFIGLPGNPSAAYVTFVMFVRPLLAHLAGALPERRSPMRVRSAFAHKKRPGPCEYVRVTVEAAADGILEARRFPKEGAALLTSLTMSDGLAELDAGMTVLSVGDMVPFHPHDVVW